MESKFSHLPDIKTIQPDRLIKYRVSEDKFSAEVLLPGLSYTDFDQKIGGKVGLWSLGKVFESIRSVAMATGFMYYLDLLHKPNRTLFVGGHVLTLNKDFHNIRYSNMFGRKNFLKADIYISDVGKSSYTVATDLYDFQSGVKLCSCKTIQVFVDKQLRKPVPLPEEIFVGLDNHLKSVKRQTIKREKMPSIPSEAFQYEIKALHSDSDFNHHVNQAMYIKWCSDAGSLGAHKGHFSYFKRHIELYPLKSAEYQFIGETLVNDIVTVNVWEDVTVKDKVLRFAVTRSGRIVFVLKLEFYDGKPVEVLPHLESKL
ncbi:uncharacterized protein LOC132744969 isoform X2 [Ruditapes philippinarum]|uniref:uncharacterized protein LOC132744969 isoform X2 n=1 Tax=Ruditapes philippinarum TaxID=129788 RepID=UPI00295AFB75|nr:uncharacterized protein LOC132744969 isoform X2 [Ruditapes philippinarum]